jgi:hypothetical protein
MFRERRNAITKNDTPYEMDQANPAFLLFTSKSRG